MSKKDDFYKVDLKPRWNFAAKFYLVCIIVFVLLFGYIMIYRAVHRDEIIENVKQQESNNTVIENTVLE